MLRALGDLRTLAALKLRILYLILFVFGGGRGVVQIALHVDGSRNLRLVRLLRARAAVHLNDCQLASLWMGRRFNLSFLQSVKLYLSISIHDLLLLLILRPPLFGQLDNFLG